MFLTPLTGLGCRRSKSMSASGRRSRRPEGMMCIPVGTRYSIAEIELEVEVIEDILDASMSRILISHSVILSFIDRCIHR